MMHKELASVNEPLIWFDHDGIGHGARHHVSAETLCGRAIKEPWAEMRYRGRFGEATHPEAHITCLWCMVVL